MNDAASHGHGAHDDASGRRLQRLRAWRNRAEADYSLGFLGSQFQREIARPHKQLGRLVELWAELVPEPLLAHTRLEGLTRGVLHVGVDSSPHLYELDQLLRAGLEREIIRRQPGDAKLRRIRLCAAKKPFGDDH